MHEWALADAVSKAVKEKAKEDEIKEVRVLLGELQNVDEEIFKEALTKTLEGINFKLEVQPAVFSCRTCGHTWKLEDIKDSLSPEVRESIHFIPEVVHAFISCPKCSSKDFEVISGRGLSLEIVTLG